MNLIGTKPITDIKCIIYMVAIVYCIYNYICMMCNECVECAC